MARRSPLDLAHGDDIRARKEVLCPQCKVPAVWRTVDELETHVRSCRIIELGLAVGKLELDDLVPEVAEKPKGWGWAGR